MSRAATVAGMSLMGCSLIINEGGNVANVPGEEVWKTEVELDVGESAFVDGRGLEITLRAIDAERATLWIVGRHRADEHRLGLWPAGGEAKTPPYRVRLLEIDGDEKVRIQVRREWGEWRP